MIGPSTSSNPPFTVHISRLVQPESPSTILVEHPRLGPQPHPIEPVMASKIDPAHTSQRKRKYAPEDNETLAHPKVSRFGAQTLEVVAH